MSVSRRVVSAHQPNYLPHIDWFRKAAASDVMILLDDVQFSKGSFTNRALAYGRHLTIPVRQKLGTEIRSVEIFDQNFPASHVGILKSIGSNKAATLLSKLQQSIAEVEMLLGYNLAMIHECSEIIGIDPYFVMSSDLGVAKTRDERLAEMVARLGGTHYIVGPGQMEYINPKPYEEARIKLVKIGKKPCCHTSIIECFGEGCRHASIRKKPAIFQLDY